MDDLNFHDDRDYSVKEHGWISASGDSTVKSQGSKIKPVSRWRDIELLNEQRDLKQKLQEVYN